MAYIQSFYQNYIAKEITTEEDQMLKNTNEEIIIGDKVSSDS